MINLLQKPLSFYAERAIRYYVSVWMMMYVIRQLTGQQFQKVDKLSPLAAKKLSQLNTLEIAGAFLGYSPSYLWFLGLVQALGALLLLFERTRLAGVAILLPVLMNAFIIGLAYGLPWAEPLNAGLLLFSLGVVAYLNREKAMTLLHILFKTETAVPENISRKKRIWRMVLNWVLIIVVVALIHGVVTQMGYALGFYKLVK